jgi:hypothetical protein
MIREIGTLPTNKETVDEINRVCGTNFHVYEYDRWEEGVYTHRTIEFQKAVDEYLKKTSGITSRIARLLFWVEKKLSND